VRPVADALPEQLVQLVVEQSSDPVVVEHQGHVRFANDRARAALGEQLKADVLRRAEAEGVAQRHELDGGEWSVTVLAPREDGKAAPVPASPPHVDKRERMEILIGTLHSSGLALNEALTLCDDPLARARVQDAIDQLNGLIQDTQRRAHRLSTDL
jgi:PAS domain-containing protein